MINCNRKGCTRSRSEFRMFLNRRRPPRFDHQDYCSETCLQDQSETELRERWRRLLQEKSRHIPRPKLGTILLERAFITPAQLDAAVSMQRRTRKGRLGEWLLELGFVEEHQITLALSRQHGIPVIHLANAAVPADVAKMIPGRVAKCSNLVPVGYNDDHSALRIAVSGPVRFGSQEALRRMLGMNVLTYIGDDSAIQSMLERLYRPEELDLQNAPTYSTLDELLEIGRRVVRSALDRRVANVQFELVESYFWTRLDCEGTVHHQFYRYQDPRVLCEEGIPVGPWALASAAVH